MSQITFCLRCRKVNCRGYYDRGDYPNYSAKWMCLPSGDPNLTPEVDAAFERLVGEHFDLGEARVKQRVLTTDGAGRPLWGTR